MKFPDKNTTSFIHFWNLLLANHLSNHDDTISIYIYNKVIYDKLYITL